MAKQTATSKYPAVGTFKDKKALQKHYKALSDAELMEWIAQEKLTFKAYPDSQPINRMRMCMAILYKHYPADAPKAKVESPYKQYTLEDLVGLAATNNVPVEITADAKIMRMRTIQALRAHKVIS